MKRLLFIAVMSLISLCSYSQASKRMTVAKLYEIVKALEQRVNALDLGDTIILVHKDTIVQGAKPVDLTAIIERITVLESKQNNPVDLSGITSRITALENKTPSTVDLSGITARITALENKTPTTVDLTPLKADIATLKTQVAAIKIVDYSATISALQTSIASIKSSIPSLQPLTDKIAALQKTLDEMPTIYIKSGYGTATNPIKP